jgi:hypothetical protein
MRPLFVVMLHELLAQMIHVLRPKHNEVVEAFLLDGLNELLSVGVHVGRAELRLYDLHPPANHLVEWF